MSESTTDCSPQSPSAFDANVRELPASYHFCPGKIAGAICTYLSMLCAGVVGCVATLDIANGRLEALVLAGLVAVIAICAEVAGFQAQRAYILIPASRSVMVFTPRLLGASRSRVMHLDDHCSLVQEPYQNKIRLVLTIQEPRPSMRYVIFAGKPDALPPDVLSLVTIPLPQVEDERSNRVG